jgi:hypothetical protein
MLGCQPWTARIGDTAATREREVTDRRDVKVPYFGTVAVADGELVVQDAGTLGAQAHSVRLGPDGRATWERWVEGLRPQGATAYGTFAPSAAELGELSAWADLAWDICARPKPPKRTLTHPPSWVWCVVVRRGNEARWLADGDDAPDELRPLLDWLRRRVDRLGGS